MIKIGFYFYSWRYAAAGAVLGIGSPLGLFFMRFYQAPRADIFRFLAAEIQNLIDIYIYTGIGTIFVFSIFGYFIGTKNDVLKKLNNTLEENNRILERLSITDGLTNLYIHSHVLQRLEEELSRAKRYRAPLSCLFIDIDGFKFLNDRYSHIFGDAVLKNISKILLSEMRGTDILGRYGGDEFLAILPETEIKNAFKAAERIREAIAEHPFIASGQSVHTTVSIGIFCSNLLPLSSKEILIMADTALRKAKNSGKNQSVVFQRF